MRLALMPLVSLPHVRQRASWFTLKMFLESCGDRDCGVACCMMLIQYFRAEAKDTCPSYEDLLVRPLLDDDHLIVLRPLLGLKVFGPSTW